MADHDYSSRPQAEDKTHWWNRWQGPAMFYLSLLFLGLLAAMMVLWIDVPRVVEVPELEGVSEQDFLAHLTPDEIEFEKRAYGWGRFCGLILLLIWPLFIAEQLAMLLSSDATDRYRDRQPYWWLFCIVPPLRLCAHRRIKTSDDLGADQMKDSIWLPGWGWQSNDRTLERNLERAFSFPMICIALLILPVLGLQFYFKENIANYPALRLFLHFGTGLIWFAFACEFIVMVSVAEKKFDYCKRHWLDLAIILLPLISFLRTLRILRASKLLKVGKLHQLSRLVRVYRLRAVTMRALRALMLLEVLHRLLRTKPESRVRKLEQQYIDKQRELEELAEEIERLKAMTKSTDQ